MALPTLRPYYVQRQVRLCALVACAPLMHACTQLGAMQQQQALSLRRQDEAEVRRAQEASAAHFASATLTAAKKQVCAQD